VVTAPASPVSTAYHALADEVLDAARRLAAGQEEAA
jgi:hypothetical protein